MHSIMQTLSRSKHKPSRQNAVGPNAKSILLMAKGPRGLFIHKGNRLSLTYFSQSGKIANVHSTVEIYYRVPRQDTHTAAVRRGRPAVSAGQIVFSVPRRGPLSFFWAFYGVFVCSGGFNIYDRPGPDHSETGFVGPVKGFDQSVSVFSVWCGTDSFWAIFVMIMLKYNDVIVVMIK